MLQDNIENKSLKLISKMNFFVECRGFEPHYLCIGVHTWHWASFFVTRVCNLLKLLRTNNFEYLTYLGFGRCSKSSKTTANYCLDSKIRTCARHYSMLRFPKPARLTWLLHTQIKFRRLNNWISLFPNIKSIIVGNNSFTKIKIAVIGVSLLPPTN